MSRTIWLNPTPLILASRSMARRRLLEAAGIPVEVAAADIDERAIEARSASSQPGDIAALLARQKARVVSAHQPGRLVVGADQTLAIDERLFSKPIDRETARVQLAALAGRTHELHCAFALVCDGVVLYDHVAVASLTMRSFSGEFLETYLDMVGAAAFESVGAYQLEGLGVLLFDRILGDHFTILGLPLLPLLDVLRRQGSLLS